MPILEGLHRLSESLKELDDHSSSEPMGHYQELPMDVQESYRYMLQGASLVHATSTKYTLMGKISLDEASASVAQDLLMGCQLLATGAMVIGNVRYGCCRSTRFHTKRAVRAVVCTVLQLVEAFVHDETHGAILEQDNNLAAQKCGAVWSSCNVFMEKKLPQGNRNAMRRDLFTWMMECNETMQEFQQLIDNGPSSSPSPPPAQALDANNDTGENEKEEEEEDKMPSFEEFLLQCNSTEDQYTASELEIAKPCVGLVKCSRGCVNVALKASDSAGKHLTSTENDTSAALSHDKNPSILQFISQLHDMARAVGEGMTDLGTLLYPTLSLDDIEQQGLKQKESIVTLLEFVLDASTDMNLDDEVVDMANKIRPAAQLRHDELVHAIHAARPIG